MKKGILAIGLLALAFLAGCGGSSDDDVVAVTVEGNIYNEGAGAGALAAEAGTAPAPTVINSVWSPLSVTDPIRLPAVYNGALAVINTVVRNEGTVDLSGINVEILIEMAAQYSKEYWACVKWFNRVDGNGGMGISCWEVYGGTYIAPQPPPVLPTCEGSAPSDSFACDPAIYDCANPWWVVEYNPPSDGLYKAQNTISALPVNEVFSASGGVGGDWDVRPDHLAQWTVRDKEGNVLARQDYIFDVIQP